MNGATGTLRCRTCGRDMQLVRDPTYGYLVACPEHSDAGHLGDEQERIAGDYDRQRAWEFLVRDEAAHRGTPFIDEAGR